jgi:nitric oxide dioxygenase
VAYASHCDDLGALGSAVDQMVQKHISFHILPEHYDMVGDCLIRALKQVLGDAGTDEIVDGWKDAYKFLADLLIGLEEKLREEKAAIKGQ